MSILKSKIENFTDSLQQLIDSQNYYSALTIALTLPDICTKLEKPDDRNTGNRYREWFDKYMSSRYQSNIGPERELHVFLNGNDFYALRCSLLHQGETNIEEQRAREVLKDFLFVKPPHNGEIHLNQINDTLQLQVDIFCLDILCAVKSWLNQHKDSVEINDRAKSIIEINNSIKSL